MSKWDLPPKEGHMDKADGIYYQNMTAKEVEERLKKDDIIVIPIGSTESHGPHSPYGEDTWIAAKMAELVAKRTGCTVAQPTWYGSHPYHHLGMPGTIVIPEDLFTAMVRAIIAGFWNAGFRKQILLNAHGQEYVIPTAIHEFGKKYQVPAILVNVNWFNVIPTRIKKKVDGGSFETRWTHADEGETSIALNLFPEMVHMEDAVDSPPKGNLPEGHIDTPGGGYHQPVSWYGHMGLVGIEAVCHPEGTVGYSTLANASKITAGVEEVLDYLVRLHDDIIKAYPPGKLPDKMTQKSDEEMDAVLKGPLGKGGKHLYTIAYPP